ncbi:MAG: phosphoribosylformylglycinamidine cyclo-ligase [Candidatus Hydrogenedentes bacterium]|nr:phosphoribosylformylglycinamidine cyclo-ligase [Candidatus Hydrogenedentota bacterium]
MTGKKRGLSYRDAGVNIDAADEALRQIKDVVSRTFDSHVLCDIGSFGAMYSFDPSSMAEPVLVSSVDGVGTKLKVAFMTGRHDTVGIDLVSHCVNDILVQGARPLFFLDYIACGVLRPEEFVDVIKGIATGCRYAGCALIGGETAEMPDMYVPGEYDLAGTIIGVVDRAKIVDGSRIQNGDVVVGVPSSGLHTNGYSLARKICFEVAGLSCDDEMPGVGRSVGDALLEPHKSYAKMVQLLMAVADIRGMTHVTGGGITDNLPRTLPEGLAAEIDLNAWAVPPIFEFLQATGEVENAEMLRTFNMGMGYLLVVSPEDAARVLDTFTQTGEGAVVIGKVVEAEQAGEKKVKYVGDLHYGTPD